MRPNAFDLDFQRFAFGIYFDTIPLDAIAMVKWNERHGETFMLKPEGIVSDNLVVMWHMYLDWKEGMEAIAQELDQQKTPIEEQVHDEGK